MRRPRAPVDPTPAVAAFGAVALVVLAVAAFFLQDVQHRQREDLRDRYADRVAISAGLLDSLFAVAFSGRANELSRQFGSDRVATAALDRQVADDGAAWGAVIDGSGSIVGVSRDAPRFEVQRLASTEWVQAALRPVGYGLGDMRGESVSTAIGFPSPSGWRAYVSVTPRTAFSAFLEGTIRSLPGEDGGRAYVLDGNGRRVASVEAGGAVPPQAPMLVAALRTRSMGTFAAGDGRRFFSAARLDSSGWRLVVTIPTTTLYASATGADRAIPWIILALTALALVGVALLLRRLMRTAGRLQSTNAELEDSNAELARSNADLEQFAYVASHDLSEPLRTVAGFSQLLGKRYAGRLDDEADLYIGHMTAGVDRMQQLIDDLLLYSRVGRAPVGSGAVDLDEVLDEVLAAVGPALERRGADVTSDDLPTVRGERGQLGQVLQNLVVNAVKFTAPDVPPRVHVSAARDGDCWRVAVADNGIGVAPDQREAIFKMFGRLHTADAYPGTGIGLALVKRIVERHGGRIWVEPGATGGSVFTFTIPDRTPVSDETPRQEVTA